MGKLLHSLVAHGSGHTFKRVSSSEDLVDGFFVIGLFLKNKQLLIEALKVFLGFFDKDFKILTNVHKRPPLLFNMYRLF